MIIRTICSILFALALMPMATAAAPSHEDIRKQLDGAIALMREGKEVPEELQKQCFDSFAAYGDSLFKKHAVDSNTSFPEPDRTEFYVNCARSGVVMPQSHGGWIQHSSLRLVVCDNLIKQVKTALTDNDKGLDSFRIYGYFQPVFDKGDSRRAIEAYELLLESDPFLAKAAIIASYQGLLGASWVVTYYRTNKQEELADKAANNLKEALFPSGFKPVKVKDYKGAPDKGTCVAMIPDAITKAGIASLEEDDIIVAVNGVDAPGLIHYCYLRDVERENPKINFIIWRGDQYKEVAVEINKTARQDGRFYNWLP